VSWVAQDDIADVAVSVLLDDALDGETFAMTGPEALDLGETAAVLARVTGRPVRYLEEAWPSRRPTRAPDWETEGWVSSYEATAAGELALVSDAVDRLTGHPAVALEPFLRSSLQLWKHLAARPPPDEQSRVGGALSPPRPGVPAPPPPAPGCAP
jgi:hypothetical protein